MKTLVYFASGPVEERYHTLDFDKIYFVDNCFKNDGKNSIHQDGKITCVGMDCLESIDFFKKEGVKIDYFVSLNEGLFEGGGRYAINSDFFLGYVMPLLKNNYIHIMVADKSVYTTRSPNNKMYNVTMDLPYDIVEIDENDDKYLSPHFFYYSRVKVLKMSKLMAAPCEISINPMINIKIIHDSIWNYYKELDSLAISISQQGQGNFFNEYRFPKILDLKKMKIDELFNYCEYHEIKKIGFIPWGKKNYKGFIEKLKERKSNYPNEILLFHLNRNDYQIFKQLNGNENKEMSNIKLEENDRLKVWKASIENPADGVKSE